MRVSQLLTTTLREVPRDVESGHQELLFRAGFIRQLTSGVYCFLPLGQRVLQKITQIMREELERIGGQELLLPILQPRELWEQRPRNGGTTRAEQLGETLFTLQDRKERSLILGPTHEEVTTVIAREFVRSYRNLPQRLYQIHTKFRDEPRSRGGLLRTREFPMLDLYSFDADQDGLDISYEALSNAFQAIFARCGLTFSIIEADSGAIGGKTSHEFFAPTEAGEDKALECDQCEYAANIEKAEFHRQDLRKGSEKPLELISTPNCSSISDLMALLHISAKKTMKAVCYVADGRLVLTAVRGDLEINETKLTNVLTHAGFNVLDLHLATAEELAAAGSVAGYTSPLEKSETIFILADHSLKQGNNFVAGANQPDAHLLNVNYPRDYRVDGWADIASAYDGAACTVCGGRLSLTRGSELGHIFQLGSRYSELLDANFLDAEGNEQLMLMGCYGIGLGRLLAVVVEQHSDERGLCWPKSIAPYQVALVGLDSEKDEPRQRAEQLYADLQHAGIEVLYDDRSESAGVKFNDADLLGLPLRIVISKRSLKNGGAELKARSSQESRIVPLSDIVAEAQRTLRRREEGEEAGN